MPNKPYENIIYEKVPPIAYITLNRPEKMNSFSDTLQVETKEAIQDAGWQDNAIRVIVIKGAGRCFSTGFDVSDVGGLSAGWINRSQIPSIKYPVERSIRGSGEATPVGPHIVVETYRRDD